MPVHLTPADRRLAILWQILVLTIIAFLLGIVLLVTQPASRGFAQGSTTILIQPSPSDVTVGDTITVEIQIENVTDLYGVDVRLSFDPALLEVQDADGNPANGVQIKTGTFPAPDEVVKNEVDNAAGTIWYAVSQRRDLHPDPVSDNGTLASVTFKGLAEGTSSVAFTYWKLVEIDGTEITTTTAQAGQITVVAASIGDYVWNDGDGDGIQSSAFDVGINGIKLELWLDNNGDGNVSTGDADMGTTTTITNTVTGKGGWYLFDGLSAGDYIVRIAPAEFDSGGTLWEYGPTKPNVGSDDTVDSDGDNPTCPYSPTIKTGSCGEIGFENNILATTTLTETGGYVSGDLDVDFGVVAQSPPTAITLSSFTSRSSAGLKTPLAWPWLMGVAALAVGGVLWVRRRR